MLDTIKSLPVGCCLNYSKMNILCYADDNCVTCPGRTGSPSNALFSFRYDTINVQKSYQIVFWYKNRKLVSDVKNDNQILMILTECKYLGVVLSYGLSSTKDVEKAKASFLKQFYSLYNKFYCMDLKVLTHSFKLHAKSFYGVQK